MNKSSWHRLNDTNVQFFRNTLSDVMGRAEKKVKRQEDRSKILKMMRHQKISGQEKSCIKIQPLIFRKQNDNYARKQ